MVEMKKRERINIGPVENKFLDSMQPEMIGGVAVQ